MENGHSFKRKYNEFMFEHVKLKVFVEYLLSLIVTALSAFAFSFGMNTFIAPEVIASAGGIRIVSGGMSGISQIVIQIGDMIFGDKLSANYSFFYGLIYTIVNLPICILAFFGVGKRFAVFSLINILMVFGFTSMMEYTAMRSFIDAAAKFVNANGGLLSRALFGGICTGIASSLAYKIDSSTGGIDVVSYYIALKKSTLVGKYSVYINIGIVAVYALLSWFKINPTNPQLATETVISSIFSLVYMITVMVVVDAVNLRNKKVEITIVTSVADLAEQLIANFPHGATSMKGTGAFSGKEKTIISMVVSSYELKKLINRVKQSDPKAFIKVNELVAVYGNFFIRPVK